MQIKIDNSPEAAMREARTLLEEADSRFLKRKVRCVARGNELEDKRVLALFTLAVRRKFHWTPQDWKVVTDRLDTCELTMQEWLDGFTDES